MASQKQLPDEAVLISFRTTPHQPSLMLNLSLDSVHSRLPRQGRDCNREKFHCCLVAKSCPTLCDLMNCSPPGSSFHGISQVRILEWVAISFSRGSSWPRDPTWVSYLAGGFFTIESPVMIHQKNCTFFFFFFNSYKQKFWKCVWEWILNVWNYSGWIHNWIRLNLLLW